MGELTAKTQRTPREDLYEETRKEGNARHRIANNWQAAETRMECAAA